MEFVIGILVGFMVGATGVGGGTLTAPLLVFALGFPARTAVATALLFSSFVKVTASSFYLWQRKIDAQVLIYLLCGGIPGAVIGSLILERLNNKNSEAWMLLVIGIIIVISASSSLFGFNSSGGDAKPRIYLLPFLSFFIGSETGFSSAGSGALGTIVLFNFTTLTPSLVVGTDLVFGLIISVLAGGIHSRSCDYAALYKLVPAGIVGAIVGARASLRLPVKTLRKAVLLCIILVGALLLRKGFAGII
jgi:uncharacterized membrane protein YfcA